MDPNDVASVTLRRLENRFKIRPSQLNLFLKVGTIDCADYERKTRSKKEERERRMALFIFEAIRSITRRRGRAFSSRFESNYSSKEDTEFLFPNRIGKT